jgi:hypothetical protein
LIAANTRLHAANERGLAAWERISDAPVPRVAFFFGVVAATSQGFAAQLVGHAAYLARGTIFTLGFAASGKGVAAEKPRFAARRPGRETVERRRDLRSMGQRERCLKAETTER